MILLVSNSTYNIWHFRRALWQALQAEGHQLAALAPLDDHADELRAAGITVYPLQHLQAHQSQPWDELLLIKELYRWYGKLKPDLILHFTIKPNIYGSWVARWYGIPAIANVTGLGTTALSGHALWRRTAWLYRLGLRNTEAVVCQNEADENRLREEGVQPQRWQLIPGSGVDPGHYAFHPLPISPPFRFLYLGRMLIDKGLRELIAAWKDVSKALPEAELHLAGIFDPTHPRSLPEGEWATALEMERLTYYGRLSDVRPELAAAQVLVLPSYREGMPRAILEAMATGRPVIATDVPGCRDLVRDGVTGQLIKPQSTKALTEAMIRYCGLSQERLERQGKNARRELEAHYSSKRVGEAYLRLIREVLTKRMPA